MSFRLFKPTGKFKKFRIKELRDGKFLAVARSHPGYSSNEQIRFVVGELEKLNDSTLSYELKLRRFVELKSYLSASRVELSSNQTIVSDYFQSVISKRKIKQSAKQASRHYLDRAVKAIGRVNLRTASIESIQEALDEAYPNQKQRQLAMYLNCLLKFIGREERIQKNRLVLQTVDYLPSTDFQTFLDAFDSIKTREVPMPAFKLLVEMALYSGMRTGEILALEPRDYNPTNNSISVTKQIDTTNTLDLPKWGKTRVVVCTPEMKKTFPLWIKHKNQISFEVRIRSARVVRQAARIAFPDEPHKWVNFKALRHSFAILCLEKGLSMELIARQLGNTVQVCERYYLGFQHSDSTLTQVNRLLSKTSF